MQAPEWGIIPDMAGWYWVKEKRQPPRPVKVFMSKLDRLCFISADGAHMQQEFGNYKWAGPIPEPK